MPGETFVINVVMTGVPQTEAGAAKVSAATRGMEASAKSASAAGAAGATSLAQKWTAAGNTMSAAGKKLNRNLTLPIIGIGAVTGKLAVDFEKAMRNVNSIAQLPEPAFRRLNKQVLAMAGPTAQAPKTLAEGLYDLVSSGFDAEESITILNASARAATAGLTTTEVSTKAVAAALNAYHRPASDAKAISDDLFQTVNLGVVTFDELASTIGYVLPAANTMGVDLKQVGASIATLTKQGQSGSNAVTNINAALTSFIKPSKAMKGVLKELGYETSLQLVKQQGFQGAIELVTRAVGGNKEAIGELFPNVRAMRAVFGLTGNGAKSAAKDLRGFQHDTGATAKVLAEQSKSIAFQWNRLKAEGAKLGIELGAKLIPVMADVAHEVVGILHAFGNLPQGVQSATIKLLAFGALMGPVLRIGGAFATMIGGIAKGMKVLAATDLAAGIAQAFRGDTAILRILGGDLAGKIATGLKVGLPVAIAAAGLGNIIGSVLDGDMKQAGFKAGGALVGGIAGAFLGGPLGAAIGAGAGSFLGGFLGDLLDAGDALKPLEAIQLRVAESARNLSQAFQGERQAVQTLVRSGDRLDRARHRQRNSAQAVRQAERALGTERRRSGADSVPAIRAEVRLAEAKHRNAKATREVRNAERLHGVELRATKDVMRATILETRHRLNVLEQERKELLRHLRAADRTNADWKVKRNLLRRLNENQEQVTKSQKQQSQVFADAARVAGPKFARFLEQASRGALDLGRNFKITLADIRNPLRGSIFAVQNFGEAAQKNTGRAKGSYEKLKGVLGPFRAETQRQMSKAGGDVREFANTTGTAFRRVETQTSSSLTALGVKEVNFGLEGGSRQRKARGGLMRLGGVGRQDTIPLDVMGVPVVAAPGEDVAFVTRHQRADLDYAVASTYGDRSLSHFFQRQNRPHYMARGGIVEPRLTGPDPMQDAGQAAIHRVTEAARAYIRKIGGDKTYTAVRKEADRMDALAQPYLWGGGHGAMPSRTGPWDCSGAVSQLLYGAGWKDLRPMVSGGFESWGEAGRGRVSVLANPGHVYSVIGGRAWGTSGENPGGGAGWIDSYVYRSGFTERHADLAGEGEPTFRRTGRGQRQVKGFDRGGFVPTGILRLANGGWVRTGYTTYSGSGGGASGDLQRGNGYAELGTATADGQGTGTGYLAQELGRSGELPFGFGLEVDVGRGKIGTLYKYDRGYGQGDSAYGLDIHTGGFAAVGLTGHSKGQAKIRPADGSARQQEERVPAVFHGARTKALSFGEVPKTLHGVDRELGKRRRELGHYRRAVSAAEGKPKIQRAIQANVTALEGRIKELERARSLLRRKAAQKKVTRKLARKLGKITGIEQQMEAAERAFEGADQYAEQVVGLEPQSPTLPSNATESQREAAEKRYVEDFKQYVDQQERPAYGAVLDRLADWRNITLFGESTAGRLETGWEKEVRQINNEIDGINVFTQKVAERREDWERKHPKKGPKDYPDWLKDQIQQVHRERARLPMLRFRDREVRGVLGEAREAFYPGREHPIQPPNAPLAGTGSIEETLTNIQGVHWPDQHSPLKPLPGKRQAGMFGGHIWDVQTAIEELDLKVNDAVSATGGGGGEGDAALEERLALEQEINRELRRALAVRDAQRPVLADYLGAYKTGGVLPADGFYYGHKDETVIPADVGPLMETHINIRGRDGWLEKLIDVEVERRLNAAGRRVGLARGTPSAPGRRASLSGGRSARP